MSLSYIQVFIHFNIHFLKYLNTKGCFFLIDTLTVFDSTNNKEEVKVSRIGIAWPSDKKRKFHNPGEKVKDLKEGKFGAFFFI